MYKIGDKVSIKDVRRGNHINGHVAYFDDGIDIDGEVVSTAYFVDRQATIKFRHEGRDYTTTMYEFDMPEKNES